MKTIVACCLLSWLGLAYAQSQNQPASPAATETRSQEQLTRFELNDDGTLYSEQKKRGQTTVIEVTPAAAAKYQIKPQTTDKNSNGARTWNLLTF